jgi:hypothetical protein
LEDVGARVFFEKQLTSSDVSASGRVVVPKVCFSSRGAYCGLLHTHNSTYLFALTLRSADLLAFT